MTIESKPKNITIFGAGIIGLSVAAILAESKRKYTITIAARDLPDDPPSQDWASLWACAGWVALGGTPREQAMQLDALACLRKLAIEQPASSVRCVELTDVLPPGDSAPWFAGRVPDFEMLYPMLVREGHTVRYGSVVLTPRVFLPWLARALKQKGVMFRRIGTVYSLGDVRKVLGIEQDVLVNASGVASATLLDVADPEVVTDRTCVVVVKSQYPGAYVHRGEGVYTYVFGRGDGTAVIGGVSEPVTDKVRCMAEVEVDLFRRAHAHLPEHFPSPIRSEYEVVEDMAGIRPLRPAGVRVEKAVVGGERVVHAYGTTIGGYIHSFGLGREAARLVEEWVSGE